MGCDLTERLKQVEFRSGF